MTERKAAAVVLASGAGTRVGAAMNKVYLPLAGRPLLHWSLAAFRAAPGIGPLLLVARPQDAEFAERAASTVGAEVVHGGGTRQESELNALRYLASRIENGEVETVLLHDGARPLIDAATIAAVLAATGEHGGAIPGLPAADIVPAAADGALAATTGEILARAQTPQGFRAADLLAVYERAECEGFSGTDTASCVERYTDIQVHRVPGDERNIKITYPHDLLVAQRLLSADAADRDRR